VPPWPMLNRRWRPGAKVFGVNWPAVKAPLTAMPLTVALPVRSYWYWTGQGAAENVVAPV